MGMRVSGRLVGVRGEEITAPMAWKDYSPRGRTLASHFLLMSRFVYGDRTRRKGNEVVSNRLTINGMLIL